MKIKLAGLIRSFLNLVEIRDRPSSSLVDLTGYEKRRTIVLFNGVA